MRPCLDCGIPTHGTRCPEHERAKQRVRNARADRSIYAGGYQAFRKQVLKYATHCARCGIALVRSKTSARGATFDHDTSTVLCRSCNSSQRRNA